MAGDPNQNNINTTDPSNPDLTQNSYTPAELEREELNGQTSGSNIRTNGSYSYHRPNGTGGPNQEKEKDEKLDLLLKLDILNRRIAETTADIANLKEQIKEIQEEIDHDTAHLGECEEHCQHLKTLEQQQQENIAIIQQEKEKADTAKAEIDEKVQKVETELTHDDKIFDNAKINPATGHKYVIDKETGQRMVIEDNGHLHAASQQESAIAAVTEWGAAGLNILGFDAGVKEASTIDSAQHHEENLELQGQYHYEQIQCDGLCNITDGKLNAAITEHNETVSKIDEIEKQMETLRTNIENNQNKLPELKEQLETKEQTLEDLKTQRNELRQDIGVLYENKKRTLSSTFNNESGAHSDHDHATAAEQNEHGDFTLERDLEHVAALEKIKSELGGSASMPLAQLEGLMPGASESFMDKMKSTLDRLGIEITEPKWGIGSHRSIADISEDVPKIERHANELEPNGLTTSLNNVFAQEVNPDANKTLKPDDLEPIKPESTPSNNFALTA